MITATARLTQTRLLIELDECKERGAYLSCDGKSRRAAAWALVDRGLAEWVGTNWGSHFFVITEAGEEALTDQVRNPT